jgi:hypothetical protein
MPNEDPRPRLAAELFRAIYHERELKKKEMCGMTSPLPSDPPEAKSKTKRERAAASASMKVGDLSENFSIVSKSVAAKIDHHPWDGCVIAHYATYEKQCLQKLGQRLPEYATTIGNLLFMDTLQLVRSGVLHPDAQGSNSIKRVLPALIPAFEEYQKFDSAFLKIIGVDSGVESNAVSGDSSADGSSAMALYRLWVDALGGTANRPDRPQAPDEQPTSEAPPEVLLSHAEKQQLREIEALGWEKLKAQLLRYCKLDTNAMIGIVRKVREQAVLASQMATGDQESENDLREAVKGGWVRLPIEKRP